MHSFGRLYFYHDIEFIYRIKCFCAFSDCLNDTVKKLLFNHRSENAIQPKLNRGLYTLFYDQMLLVKWQNYPLDCRFSTSLEKIHADMYKY